MHKNIVAFSITAVSAYMFYLFFTAGTWSIQELVAGAFLAVVVAAITTSFHFRDTGMKRTPLRTLLFIVYAVFPFFIELTKANIEVAVRVVTGRIRPGIIKYTTGLKTDFGIMLLANSITLTPGTLTVNVDESTNDLYVHILNIKPGMEKKPIWEGSELFSFFDLSKWIRKISE